MTTGISPNDRPQTEFMNQRLTAALSYITSPEFCKDPWSSLELSIGKHQGKNGLIHVHRTTLEDEDIFDIKFHKCKDEICSHIICTRNCPGMKQMGTKTRIKKVKKADKSRKKKSSSEGNIKKLSKNKKSSSMPYAINKNLENYNVSSVSGNKLQSKPSCILYVYSGNKKRKVSFQLQPQIESFLTRAIDKIEQYTGRASSSERKTSQRKSENKYEIMNERRLSEESSTESLEYTQVKKNVSWREDKKSENNDEEEPSKHKVKVFLTDDNERGKTDYIDRCSSMASQKRWSASTSRGDDFSSRISSYKESDLFVSDESFKVDEQEKQGDPNAFAKGKSFLKETKVVTAVPPDRVNNTTQTESTSESFKKSTVQSVQNEEVYEDLSSGSARQVNTLLTTFPAGCECGGKIKEKCNCCCSQKDKEVEEHSSPFHQEANEKTESFIKSNENNSELIRSFDSIGVQTKSSTSARSKSNIRLSPEVPRKRKIIYKVRECRPGTCNCPNNPKSTNSLLKRSKESQFVETMTLVSDLYPRQMEHRQLSNIMLSPNKRSNTEFERSTLFGKKHRIYTMYGAQRHREYPRNTIVRKIIRSTSPSFCNRKICHQERRLPSPRAQCGSRNAGDFNHSTSTAISKYSYQNLARGNSPNNRRFSSCHHKNTQPRNTNAMSKERSVRDCRRECGLSPKTRYDGQISKQKRTNNPDICGLFLNQRSNTPFHSGDSWIFSASSNAPELKRVPSYFGDRQVTLYTNYTSESEEEALPRSTSNHSKVWTEGPAPRVTRDSSEDARRQKHFKTMRIKQQTLEKDLWKRSTANEFDQPSSELKVPIHRKNSFEGLVDCEKQLRYPRDSCPKMSPVARFPSTRRAFNALYPSRQAVEVYEMGQSDSDEEHFPGQEVYVGYCECDMRPFMFDKYNSDNESDKTESYEDKDGPKREIVTNKKIFNRFANANSKFGDFIGRKACGDNNENKGSCGLEESSSLSSESDQESSGFPPDRPSRRTREAASSEPTSSGLSEELSECSELSDDIIYACR